MLPKPIARLVARGVLRADDRKSGPYATLRDLLPGVRYDFNIVGEKGVEYGEGLSNFCKHSVLPRPYQNLRRWRQINTSVQFSRRLDVDALG